MTLNRTQQKKLLQIARASAESLVRDGKIAEFKITDEDLKEWKGAFVTLIKKGKLRGCIGQIIASEKPLWRVVSDMAMAACCEDSRFDPVEIDELPELQYEVSVLSAPTRIDDWKKIELGKHGVIIRKGTCAGLFLPQVATETGWSRKKFLEELCKQKAGLGKDCYKDSEAVIEVFEAEVFGEEN